MKTFASFAADIIEKRKELRYRKRTTFTEDARDLDSFILASVPEEEPLDENTIREFASDVIDELNDLCDGESSGIDGKLIDWIVDNFPKETEMIGGMTKSAFIEAHIARAVELRHNDDSLDKNSRHLAEWAAGNFPKERPEPSVLDQIRKELKSSNHTRGAKPQQYIAVHHDSSVLLLCRTEGSACFTIDRRQWTAQTTLLRELRAKNKPTKEQLKQSLLDGILALETGGAELYALAEQYFETEDGTT